MPDLLDEFPEMIPGHLRDAVGVWGPNRRFDTVLMGRGTYEVGLPLGVASPYPRLRQIVVSSTMTEPPDPAVELVREDVVQRVRALKAEPGADLWLCGAAGVAATLASEIDELVLKVNPPNGFALLRGRLGRPPDGAAAPD